MICGINFNGVEIPADVKRRFAPRVRLRPRTAGKPAVFAELKGACDSKAEKTVMVINANNGHRNLHVEERKIGDATWYGIYVYWGEPVGDEHAVLVAEAHRAIVAHLDRV